MQPNQNQFSNQAPQPQSAPDDKKLFILIGVIIGGLLLIFVVLLVIVMASKSDTTDSAMTNTNNNQNPTNSLEALQRNQRNDARKRDVSSVVQAVTVYASNNPAPLNEIKDGVVYKDDKSSGSFEGYLDQLSKNTEIVRITSDYDEVDNLDLGRIIVLTGYKCDSSTSAMPVLGSKHTAAVITKLEPDQLYCQSAS
ncbi:hypothetical protein FWF74_03205 [Candidatus Saccharibacteria bacterium]|nr:hypothetical protein [Candidatus Saccharibacteria bacterium]MCL1962816.1 hypothetical protein [Candidatus Saccharibacteria bacterium]